jgi:hypothetical protein
METYPCGCSTAQQSEGTYDEGASRPQCMSNDEESRKNELTLDILVHVMQSGHIRCTIRDYDVGTPPLKELDDFPSCLGARDVSLHS